MGYEDVDSRPGSIANSAIPFKDDAKRGAILAGMSWYIPLSERILRQEKDL